MLIFRYASKKDLRACIGQALRYTETSIHGPEYTPNGKLVGSNRPSITGIKGREFFAEVTLANGLIANVK